MDGDPRRTGRSGWIPVEETPPAPPPAWAPGWAPAPMPWAPPPPEPDPFWGRAAVHRIPGVPERRFWSGRSRPQHRMPFLLWSGLRAHRLALVLLGLGFFAVFLKQAPLHVQIVVGAPVFEEFFKFGLALLIVSRLSTWVPLRMLWAAAMVVLAAAVGLGVGALAAWRGPPSVLADVPGPVLMAGTAALFAAAALLGRLGSGLPRGLRGLLALPVVWLVGASFGVLEHYMGYWTESGFEFLARVAFHAGATVLTFVLYLVLEPLRDARVRWLALAPSVLVHWLNNFTAVANMFISLLVPGLMPLILAWHHTLSFIVYPMVLAAVLWAGRLRRWALRGAAKRFPPMPPRWRAHVAGPPAARAGP